jgi:hypothetical protein
MVDIPLPTIYIHHVVPGVQIEYNAVVIHKMMLVVAFSNCIGQIP